MSNQLYPIGKQVFRDIRQGGFVYVDKTPWAWKLVEHGGNFFLSRPRRFGKTLFVSTLKEVFGNNRSLFDGLWIEDKLKTIPARPVLHLSMNNFETKSGGLENGLKGILAEQAAHFGLHYKNTDVHNQFRELILHLSKKERIVVLIDEYDKPLIDHLDDIEKAKQHRDFLKTFYIVLKALEEHIFMVFITGVSKFGQISIFSDLNHLEDLSNWEGFGAALGFTQKELDATFSERIKEIAQENSQTITATSEEIQRNYNGYSWDGQQHVYNPFSVLRLMKSGRFANYWYETGTPTFLTKYVKKHNLPQKIDGFVVQQGSFNTFELDNLDPFALLFQTGYLTIKKMEGSGIGSFLHLGYPNEEVRYSFEHSLLATYSNQDASLIGNQLFRLRQSMEKLDAEGFVEQLKAFFASIPYDEAPDNKTKNTIWEGYFHALTFLLLKVIGMDVRAEVASAKGKTDALVFLPTAIWIVEFKLGTAKSALKQIKENGYADPYIGTGLPIILLGLGFDKKSRNVKTWASEQV